MTNVKRDLPSKEFWDSARPFIESCSPEELRILRIMAATELEKRLKQWDSKLAISSSEEKARKTRAIKRNIKKAAK